MVPRVLLDRLQFQLHTLPQFHVERAQRLVQQEYGGTVDQGSGQGHSLLLSTRKLVGGALTEAAHTDDLEHVVDPFRDLALGNLLELETVCHVVEHRHMGEQLVVLEDHVGCPLVGLDQRHVLASQVYRALVGGLETGQHPQGCGLTAPTRAEQREELALLDLEGHIVHGQNPAEPLGHPVKADSRMFGVS